MINKKILFSVRESLPYIRKNVIDQWIGLICNVVSTASLCLLIVERELNFKLVGVIGLMIILRYFVNQRAIKNSYQSSQLVKEKMRTRLYTKLTEIGSAYSNQWSTAEIVQLASEGVEQLEIYFANYIPQFFYAMIAPLTLFIILLFMDARVALALLICVPLIPVSIVFVQKFAKKLLNKYWGQYTNLTDHFLENLQGLTTLKIYEADQRYHEKMNVESEKFRKITMRVLTMQLNSIIVMDFIAYGGSALGIIFALMALKVGNITLFQALFILLISSEFFIPMRQLGSYFHVAMNGMAAADKMFNILEAPTRKKEQYQADTYHFQARDLSFAYEKDHEILHQLSFSFDSGLIAFVGESGSGKSTIADLLMSQYDTYTGSLRVNDQEIRDIDVFSFLTFIRPESYLFAGSIRENLQIAKKDASDKEMNEALKKAGVLEFIESQNGLDTLVLENGKNFSGGQRQRLCLARALLKDSQVYILDEATSNIDRANEDDIMNRIYALSKEKLVICISHRLANIKKAQCIYCLEKGRIVEFGTHEQLLQNQSVYANLWNTQCELESYGGSDEDYI